MAQQVINVGAAPDDGTGDFVRAAYQKCNANFTELYSAGGGLPSSTMSQFDVACSDGNFAFQSQPASHTTLTSNSTVSLLSTTLDTTISATTGVLNLGTAQTTGTIEIGGTATTGNISLGRATGNNTIYVGFGLTSSGNTCTINIGNRAVAGSNTNVALGNTTNNSSVSAFGSINLNGAASNIQAITTTGLITIGAAAQTGSISVGVSTDTQTINIGASAVASGKTKAINIGTLGLSGSTTTIILGSTASTTTVTVNGPLTANTVLKTGVFTVSALPATPGTGARAFVSDATATTFGTTVAGGGSNFVPVFYDGANWKIG